MDADCYVILGGDGPVGRTTTAVRLGVALEREGTNVALVDADFETTSLATTLATAQSATVQDVLDREASVNDAVTDGPSGVTVLPAARNPYPVDSGDRFQVALRRLIDPLTAAHDVILIDTPRGFERLHRELLAKATGAILVTTTDETAIESTATASDGAEMLETPVIGVVVTRTESAADAVPVVDVLDAPAIGLIPDSRILAGATGYPEIKGSVEDAYVTAATALRTYRNDGAVDEDAIALSVDEAATMLTDGEEADSTTPDPTEPSAGDGSKTRLHSRDSQSIGKQIADGIEAAVSERENDPSTAPDHPTQEESADGERSPVDTVGNAMDPADQTTEEREPGDSAPTDSETDESATDDSVLDDTVADDSVLNESPTSDERGESPAGSSSPSSDTAAGITAEAGIQTLEEAFVDEKEEDPGRVYRVRAGIVGAITGFRSKLAAVGQRDDAEAPNPLDELQREKE